MQKSVFCFSLALAAAWGAGGSPAHADDWYVSNAGGMELEPVFSRVALRGKYALSVGEGSYADLPERLRERYDGDYRIELRCLYEEGIVSRRQWSFKDDAGLARLVAVFEDDNSGFIELYNADKLIAESHQLGADGSDYITYFFYNRTFLTRAETWLYTPPYSPKADAEAEEEAETAETDELADGDAAASPELAVSETAAPVAEASEGGTEALWTDYYRYARSYALRGVERQYHKQPAEGQEPVFFRFPQLITSVTAENEFVKPGSVFSSEFFDDVIVNSGDRILYNTDERGRVQSEVRRDANDAILGEVTNTWSGDRLVSVLWKSDAEERLVEYEYNGEGDRVFERNLRDGVLERTVRREGDHEIEELYMNGAVALRAIWEDGRKISEEPVRGGAARSSSGRSR